MRELSARTGVAPTRLDVGLNAARELDPEELKLVRRLVDLAPSVSLELRRERSRALREALDAAMAADPLGELDDPMSGSERVKSWIESANQMRANRLRVLADCVNAEEASLLSHRSRQNLEAWRRNGRAIALREGNQWRYPVWQFSPDHDGGILPGIQDVLAGLRLSVAATALWLTEPSRMLDGRRPLDLLREGQAKRVAIVAEELGHSP